MTSPTKVDGLQCSGKVLILLRTCDDGGYKAYDPEQKKGIVSIVSQAREKYTRTRVCLDSLNVSRAHLRLMQKSLPFHAKDIAVLLSKLKDDSETGECPVCCEVRPLYVYHRTNSVARHAFCDECSGQISRCPICRFKY